MATSGNTCLPGTLCLHTILSFWEVFAKQSREDAQSVDGAGQIVVVHDRGSEGLLVLNCFSFPLPTFLVAPPSPT
jgi:hypothetical protein